jgi:PhnB protein
MMQWNTFLTFNGQCEAAFRFYQRCFGGQIGMILTWGDSPMANQVPPEWADKVCHATLTVGNNVLSGADVPTGQYEPPRGFGIQINIDAAAKAERMFQTLAEGGNVRMPMQKTFWALRYGEVTDQFGITWMINGEQAQ